jgi:hypothetical protein
MTSFSLEGSCPSNEGELNSKSQRSLRKNSRPLAFWNRRGKPESRSLPPAETLEAAGLSEQDAHAEG